MNDQNRKKIDINSNKFSILKYNRYLYNKNIFFAC